MTLTSRISAALSSSRHTDALVLLAELRLRKLVPKLGSLQRWVRDCDAASRSDGSFGDSEVLRVLDAVLRSTIEGEVVGEEGEGPGPVRRQDEWELRAGSGQDYFKEVQEGILPRSSLSLIPRALAEPCSQSSRAQSVPRSPLLPPYAPPSPLQSLLTPLPQSKPLQAPHVFPRTTTPLSSSPRPPPQSLSPPPPPLLPPLTQSRTSQARSSSPTFSRKTSVARSLARRRRWDSFLISRWGMRGLVCWLM